MKTLFLSAFAVLALFIAPAAIASPEVGQPAPDFTGTDTHGIAHSLSDFKGKIVVLEWSNKDCPFVVKHYGSGNMQALQKEATDAGVVWLTIVSSAEGKQGYMSADEANAHIAEMQTHSTARLLDSSGEIGHLYEAKTTPHMFVIDAEGTLVYKGAIDDNSSANPATIEGATNYVRDALHSLAAGEPVKTASSNPYGCAVKY